MYSGTECVVFTNFCKLKKNYRSECGFFLLENVDSTKFLLNGALCITNEFTGKIIFGQKI